jgi:hypothetical protein
VLAYSEASGLIKIAVAQFNFRGTCSKKGSRTQLKFWRFLSGTGQNNFKWASLNIAWAKPNDQLAPNAGPS